MGKQTLQSRQSVSKAHTCHVYSACSSSPTSRWRVVFRDTAQHRRAGHREDKGSGTRLDNKLTPCQSSPLPAWGWELGGLPGKVRGSFPCRTAAERLTPRILRCSERQLERRCRGATDESGSSPRLAAGPPNSPGPCLMTHCSQLSSSH